MIASSKGGRWWLVTLAVVFAGCGERAAEFPSDSQASESHHPFDSVHRDSVASDAEHVRRPRGRTEDARDAWYRSEPTPGWPTLFGPTHDGIAGETRIATRWPDTGPPEVWRVSIGTGYSAPVVAEERLVIFHRVDDREILDALDPETARPIWSQSWATNYDCPVGYSSGPYSTPVVDGGFVYALGAQGTLHAVGLEDGRERWRRSLHEDYDVRLGFYPTAGSPLLAGDRLILNIGGRDAGAGIVAIGRDTGKTLWTATDDGASCATPRAATVHGRPWVFVWTAEALVSLDPADGRVLSRIPFSALNPETIHASSPAVWNDLVFVSGYQIGSLCVRVLPDGRLQELWRGGKQVLDSQYNNLIARDGFAYGFPTVGRGYRCIDLATGRLQWSWRSKLRNAATLNVGTATILFDERGNMAAVEATPEGAKQLAMTAKPIFPGRLFSAPALYRGRLFLRNEEMLLCLDLRLPHPERSPDPCRPRSHGCECRARRRTASIATACRAQ